MKTYNIKIFSLSRVLLGVAILPIAILVSIFLGAELNIFISLIFLILYLWIWYYFTIRYVEITISETQLKFKWQQKLLFNHENIDLINVTGVKEFVVEKDMYLRKIKFNDSVLKIYTYKWSGKDSQKLYNALIDLSFKHKIKVITSWQEFFSRKVNRIIYKALNILIFLLGIIALALLLLK